MASAAEQNALTKSPQVNPEVPLDDFADEAYAPGKGISPRHGFLKVRLPSGLLANLFES